MKSKFLILFFTYAASKQNISYKLLGHNSVRVLRHLFLYYYKIRWNNITEFSIFLINIKFTSLLNIIKLVILNNYFIDNYFKHVEIKNYFNAGNLNLLLNSSYKAVLTGYTMHNCINMSYYLLLHFYENYFNKITRLHILNRWCYSYINKTNESYILSMLERQLAHLRFNLDFKLLNLFLIICLKAFANKNIDLFTSYCSKMLIAAPISFHRQLIFNLYIFLTNTIGIFYKYYNLSGITLIIKGKVGRKGIGRKIKYKLICGSHSYNSFRGVSLYSLDPVFLSGGLVGVSAVASYRLNVFK